MTPKEIVANHRRRFPDQYNHPLCGKRVRVDTNAVFQGAGVVERVVERVVKSRFGLLASVPDISTETFWRVQDCREIG